MAQLTEPQPRPVLNRNFLLVALLGIIAVAAFLRFFELGTESYWIDEIIMVEVTRQDLGAVWENILSTGRPPVYVLLSHFWGQVFGNSEIATRSLSAVAGVLAVPVMFLVGRRLFNPTVGLLGALLLGISTFHLYYSQDHRYYSLLILFALLTVLFYARALATRRWADFGLYILFGVLTFYTHSFAMFFLFSIGLHFVLQFWRHKAVLGRFFVSELILLAAMAPGLWGILRGFLGIGASEAAAAAPAADGNAWITPPSLFSPVRSFINFVFYDYHYISFMFLAVGAAILLLGAAFFLIRRRASFRQQLGTDLRALFSREQTGWLLLLILWLLLPVLIPLVVSLLDIAGSMYLDRYVSTAAPALFLLLALIIYTARSLVPIPVTLVAYLVIIAPSLQTYYNTQIKEQWRDLAAYVAAEAAPDDLIAIAYGDRPEYRTDERDSFFWYYPQPSEDCFLNMIQSDQALASEIVACSPQNGRLWVVIHGDNPQRMADLDEYFKSRDASAGLVQGQQYLGASAYLFQLPAEL